MTRLPNSPDDRDPTLIRRANVLMSIWETMKNEEDEKTKNVLSKLFNEIKNSTVADSVDIWDWIESDKYHFSGTGKIIQSMSTNLTEKDALFGIRLRQLMVEKKLTQKELSQKLRDHGVNVTHNAISCWVNKNTYNRVPLTRNRTKILSALSVILNVSVEYLGGMI